MLELHGPATSKVTSSANQTIRELETIIKSFTAENMELQKKLSDIEAENLKLRNQLKVTEADAHFSKAFHQKLEQCDNFKETMRIAWRLADNDVQRLQWSVNEQDAPGYLPDYLQIWGFTAHDAYRICKCMELKFTKHFQKLLPEDWEPGGDMHALVELSVLEKEYLKWLNYKLNDKENMCIANPDIMKEIASKWRTEVKSAYEHCWTNAQKEGIFD